MILAIDDDPEILSSLRRALTGIGCPVLTTEDADQVFAILQDQPIDLLISDIDMPAMNGLELIRRVRTLHPDVVRILLTGHGTYDAARRAINEGEVHRFLSKPFDPADLRRTVKDGLLRRQELARRSRSGVEADRRRALHAQLETEHPGITRLKRDPTGAYVVSEARAAWGNAALQTRRVAVA
jgi:two-component system, probable response regulator PhcQ